MVVEISGIRCWVDVTDSESYELAESDTFPEGEPSPSRCNLEISGYSRELKGSGR